jgi:MFS family permease
MTTEPNPYQSPVADAEVIESPFAAGAASGAGVWREGQLLVMHKMAQLPNVCLRTGEAADRRVTRKLQWHHPAIVLLVFAGVLIYLIVALVTMKKATIEIPISNRWMRGRNTRLAIAIGIGLIGVALFIAGFVGETNQLLSHEVFMTFLIGGIVVGVGGLIAAVIVAPIISVSKITDTHVYLKGVHQKVLSRFPPVK